MLGTDRFTGLAFVTTLLLAAGGVAGQAANQVTALTPSSAAQGTTGLLISFSLDTDVPPAPGAGILPTSVTIGTNAGTSITHSSQYTVTAVFSISAGESAGAKDVSVVFPTPNGTVTFSKAGGFTVTAASVPPSITQQPQSLTGSLGNPATFTVTASGTLPLSYQWQKGSDDITGATGAS